MAIMGIARSVKLMDNENSNTLDLHELFNLLLKNIIFIGFITILITLATGLYTKYGITEKYESQTLITVSKIVDENQTNYTSDIFRYGTELAKRYSIISKSNTVIKAVQEDLLINENLSLTTNQIQNSFTVNSVNETDILKITVNYRDPVHAEKIAQSVTKVSMRVYEEKYFGTIVTSIDEANFNDNAVSPNFKLNLIVGFVLGSMVAVGIVLLKEFMNRVVKSEKEIEKYLNIPCLGLITDKKLQKNI